MKLLLITLAAALAATPALAHKSQSRGVAINDDSNPHWLDYQTDLSEARRELRSDLDDADDASDRQDAHAEYAREVADAKSDYAKEMLEKGYRTGTVEVVDE